MVVVYFSVEVRSKTVEAGFKGVFYPTGDADKDIRDIREHYRGVTACHPENFVQI